MILIIFGLFLGSASQMQIKYDKCAKVSFKGSVCKLEKKMHTYKR